jgi:mono/diheme cytochrome c family protein
MNIRMNRIAMIALGCCCLEPAAFGHVTVQAEQLNPADPAWKFKAIPGPSKSDIAQGATLTLTGNQWHVGGGGGAALVNGRLGCAECHGSDGRGKLVADAQPVWTWYAPNITRGGVTRDYRAADWDRIVRHGVKKDGSTATMPSMDFMQLSDQELSDAAAYYNAQQQPLVPLNASTDYALSAWVRVDGDDHLGARRLAARHEPDRRRDERDEERTHERAAQIVTYGHVITPGVKLPCTGPSMPLVAATPMLTPITATTSTPPPATTGQNQSS